MDSITLNNGNISVGISPEFGASVTGFACWRNSKWTNIFRRWEGTLSTVGMFLMAPWVGRIPDLLIPTEQGEAKIEHPVDAKTGLHGIVRQFPWEVTEKGINSARLQLNFRSGDRGFTYLSDFSANVQYAIDGTTLDVILTIENTGKNLMPASSGSHPFILKRDSEPLVQFQAAGWFPPDTTRLVPAGIGEELPAELNRETPGPMGEAWDQSLFGWKAPATLIWGAEDLTLELGVGPTDTASGCLQLWSGFGKPVFALEQQTAPADAARVLQRGETRSGLVWLNPGEKLTTHHKFRVGRTR